VVGDGLPEVGGQLAERLARRPGVIVAEILAAWRQEIASCICSFWAAARPSIGASISAHGGEVEVEGAARMLQAPVGREAAPAPPLQAK
jgi:hypothetical protein